MKKYVLKTVFDYSLIHLPENSVTPYCVAWLYSEDTDSWGQGHYFSEYADAVDYFKLCVKNVISAKTLELNEL